MKKGFTLVEIIIVIAILAILMGIGVSTFLAEPQSAQSTKSGIDIDALQSAIELEILKTGKAPTSLEK